MTPSSLQSNNSSSHLLAAKPLTDWVDSATATQRLSRHTSTVVITAVLHLQLSTDIQGRSQHFWFGGLSPEVYLLPFLPLLLLPSLSFSFSFRLLPFSSRILFSGVRMSGERYGIDFRTF